MAGLRERGGAFGGGFGGWCSGGLGFRGLVAGGGRVGVGVGWGWYVTVRGPGWSEGARPWGFGLTSRRCSDLILMSRWSNPPGRR
ncbi:hypothetical protein DZF91_21470 [Actinomadura logoneensis]|uniref:Uncharacterized protein n=1 Tax=Actinomadura logoneensis TaxID=2293572 RepID=A0A372JID8_9ACTN|nr:hypothetical protein DZF91_21470 [Actinomadura logoneensis]